jgi:pimeloyl-ACP methyl ester carboxylesterase
MRYLSIDNYLADLDVAVDELGGKVDLVGLCQGGWMALLFAARFPESSQAGVGRRARRYSGWPVAALARRGANSICRIRAAG